MDGIQIFKDQNNFPICSGYKCENILNSDYNSKLQDTCVPFGLVVFPNIQKHIETNNANDFIEIDVIENDNLEIQNKILDKLLKSNCSYKSNNKTCVKRPTIKIRKTRKLRR